MTDVAVGAEPQKTFDDMPLSSPVRRAIAELGFKHPTPVQLLAYAPATEGHDLIVQSRTGTGKTLAFGLPLVDRLVEPEAGLQALILAPTRELALQSQRVLEQVGRHVPVSTVAVYGGAPMEPQIAALKRGVEIVSGTPGRVLDHIQRGTLDPRGIRALVLDEADEMFSMGFAKELHAIIEALPARRQFLCFSATIDGHVQRMAERHMREPEFLTLSSDQVGASEISHHYYMVLGDKLSALVSVLQVEDPESAIIFCNTKSDTESVARGLVAAGFEADWLNGDLPQRDREKIMQRTREGKLRYMVATDVAARGIDISHLTHVINYGFPESAEQYVHRTGRTGRAGRTGTAISVIGPANLGALYLLRLTYKIFPIERSLPSATEVATRREVDRLLLLTEAFGEVALDENRELVRRLLTHPAAERVLSGLLASFFASSSVASSVDDDDIKAQSGSASRAVPKAALVARDPEGEDEAVADERRPAERPEGAGRKKRRRRVKDREGEAASPVQGEDLEEAPSGETALEPLVSPDLDDMTTLYLNVGRRDGLEPTDVAALLSGTTGLSAADIGRVRVKDRHTFVGVPAERADAVIAALAGQTLKTRALHVERART